MEHTGRTHPTIRFGVFEVDSRSGELRKGGTRIRLQDQPFKVLLALLERPGEVVTREELQQRIWPDESFGDFDHGVHVAIAKLRTALSDSADIPRYVETLPRRGYRFVFPVPLTNGQQTSKGNATSEAVAPFTSLAPSIEISTVPAQSPGTTVPATRRMSVRPLWSASIGTIIVVAVVVGWFVRPKPPKLSEKDTVVLAEFTNNTGDAVFTRTMKRGLGIALEQSPYIKILSGDQIEETLGYMKRPANTPLTAEIAREVCKRTSGAAVLDGAIDRVGSQYVVTVKATNCQSGQLLGETEFRAADKNGVLDALGKASSEIRHQLGESIASVKKSDKPLAEVSTTSLDALRAYTLWNYEDDDDAAAALLRRSVELDPHFALAYLQLADMYAARGEAEGAIKNLKKAFEFRTQASEWERLLIESRYEENVTGDMERAHELYELRTRLYPADSSAWEGAGGLFAMLGKFDQALATQREAIKVDPDKGASYSPAALYAVLANRIAEAQTLNALAIAKGVNDPGNTYVFAFLNDDAATMQKAAKASEGTTSEEQTISMDSDSEARIGHLKKADELSAHVVDLCLKKRRPEEGAECQLNIALREAEVGNSAEARALSERALALAPTRDVKILAAIALARAGRADDAERLADEVDKLNPQNTQIQHYWLPTARAAIYLRRKQPQKAIEALRSTVDLELGLIYPTIEVNGLLYPIFLRGEALLLLHRGQESALEFQKFSDHRTIVLNNPLGALAKLQTGRAFAMQGDTAKARAAYEEFLNLWKVADPGIPILRRAKAEYAALQ
jgi:eukaryotic-like serine/threonine-protein kinase